MSKFNSSTALKILNYTHWSCGKPQDCWNQNSGPVLISACWFHNKPRWAEPQELWVDLLRIKLFGYFFPLSCKNCDHCKGGIKVLCLLSVSRWFKDSPVGLSTAIELTHHALRLCPSIHSDMITTNHTWLISMWMWLFTFNISVCEKCLPCLSVSS